MPTPSFIKAPIALVNNFVLPHPKARKVSLKDKVIVVTGATPGSIGYESAKVFLQWGAKVIVTVRSQPSLDACEQAFKEGLKASGIDVQLLDLEQSESVQTFANYVRNNYQRLDVLLNNAGVYFDMLGKWKQEKLSSSGQEIHWRINYLGTVELTNSLYPLLEKTAKNEGEARVLAVSSHMHDNCLNEELFTGLSPYKSVKAYGRSKLAVMHFMFEMHRKHFESDSVKFICVHPGSVYTNLVEKGLSDNPTLVKIRNSFAWAEKAILLNPVEGAQTQIMCAIAEGISSGSYYRRCTVDRFSPTLNDQKAARRLWQQTKAWFQEQDVSVSLDR
jgi:NAD(P)-dependent dehydrogenase (short-subunit alcohol dehydrogenase family)